MIRPMLTAAVFLATAGAASAQTTDQDYHLVENATEEEVFAALGDLYAQNLERVVYDGEGPTWSATVYGVEILLQASACEDDFQYCSGLYLMAFYGFPPDVTDKPAFVAEMNDMFAALKARQIDDQIWVMSRYEILDYGRTRDNLAEAISVFAELNAAAAP